jgi:hypothetical protein
MRIARLAQVPWVWLVTTVAITAVVIAFGRFKSNERIAQAISAGVIRRRSESATSTRSTDHPTPTHESRAT